MSGINKRLLLGHLGVYLSLDVCCLAAPFQHLMDKMLAPHQNYTSTYIDDIILFLQTWEQHCQHLQAHLQELRKAGVTASPKKRSLWQNETKYLGFQIGQGQIKPLADKVEAMKAYRLPRTLKQFRSFLGFTNYYRRFIRHFSKIVAPLTDMMKGKPRLLNWSKPTV